MLSIFVIGITTLPASAHGSEDNDMPGMPNDMDDMGHMPGYGMSEESVEITTDVIRINAMLDMPAFTFWYNGDASGETSGFMAAYTNIAEFEDANGDGAYQLNETLYSAPLGAYEWSIQTGQVLNDEGVTTEVWLKYTKSGAHPGGAGDNHEMPGMDLVPSMYLQNSSIERFEEMTLQFWAHIYLQDFDGNVTDSEGVQAVYSVAGGAEMKIDIEIGNFPFSSNTSNVAIQTMLREHMDFDDMMQGNDDHMFMTQEQFQNRTGNSMMDWTTEHGNETRFNDVMGTHMQGIDFMDNTTGLTQGFYRWVDKAVITSPGGNSEAVNVTASYVATGMGLSLFLAYPNFDNGTLLHDPSIGLIEGSEPVVEVPLLPIAAISAIGIIMVIVVIAALRRR